jgi:GntR family transcriptional regulator
MPFPSVRQLSQELGINPNTAHRITAALVSAGVVITTPAVGSVVAERRTDDHGEGAALLGGDLERLVVEAKKLGLTLDDVTGALAAQWRKLGSKQFQK